VADAPSLNVPSASGSADAAIPLAITVGLTDGSETLGPVTIDGVPTAYTLSHGVSIDNGLWQVNVSDLPSLSLIPVDDVLTGVFTLHVVATSIDGASTAASAGDLSVTVTPAATQTFGHVVDGYVAGATIFADANNNGILDAGEAHAITNADGSFTLIGGSGSLVMSGGTDVSTGLAFHGVLRAPEDS